MKKVLIGLSILGLTNLMNSQSLTQNVSEEQLNEVILSPSKNANYYNAVYNPNDSKPIQQLELEASNYDITKSKVFTHTFDTYQVLFSNTTGNIIAYYDDNGKLINSVEKYEGVRLPETVINSLKSNYADWKLNSTAYLVNYYQGKDVKKVYQVQLTKDHKKMNLKIDSDGTILNPRKN